MVKIVIKIKLNWKLLLIAIYLTICIGQGKNLSKNAQ